TERFAVQLPSHIVVRSNHNRDALLQIGVPEERISLIPCGIDWQMIQDLDPAEGDWDLAFVGRLIKAKNVGLLLEGVANLLATHPNIRCAIVGEGPERPHLEQLAANLDLGSHVIFLGRLEEAQDVYALIKSTKVFVTPSRREGFNITALEANACGTPVVTIDHPQNATTDLIENGENGWVCAPDPQSMSRCVARLLSDPPLLERMSETSLRFSEKFDWNNTAQQEEKLYRSLISGQSGTRT
ncbi:MAG: glycosyltransferase, partial [Anaerolineae bacterium]